MNKYFYNTPTFTDATWALLVATRFCLALMVMMSIGHLNNFTNLGGIINVLSDFGGKTAVMIFLMVSGISVGYSYSKNKTVFLNVVFYAFIHCILWLF